MEIIKTLFPNLPERLLGLGEMEGNLRWSWHLGPENGQGICPKILY